MSNFHDWWYPYLQANLLQFIPARTTDDHFDMLRHAAQDAWMAAMSQSVPSVPDEVMDHLRDQQDAIEDEYETDLDGC